MLLGYLAVASVRLTGGSRVSLVTVGYDRIRIIRPVLAGEDIDAVLTVVDHDEVRGRIIGSAELHAGGRLVVGARHIIQRVD